MPEKKKSVVPPLRFPEFRDAGEWERYRFRELLTLEYGASLPEESRLGGAIPVVGSNGVVGFHNQALISGPVIIVGRKGSVGEINWIELDCYPIDTTFYVKLESQDTLLAFIKLLLENANLTCLSDNGAVPGLNRNDVYVLKTALPREAEQQKIADCLSSLDEVIDLEAQKLEALKAHKKGLMQQLFPREGETAPHLRFPEFHDAEEWEVKRLGEVCSTFTGGTPSSSRKEYYGGSIPFIRSAEIDQDRTELFLTEEGLKNSSAKLVIKGDILIALYGANSGNGALSKIDGAINQAILCLRSKFNHTFILDYWRLRKNEIVMQYLQGGQGNLSAEIVKSIAFAFPSLPEQQKIADCLSSLDEVINLQTQKLDALKAHKKGLMQQLFPSEVD
jgi:type I restriction enzyme S subunit